MKNILIYRFSAIGDVVMLLPAIKAALAANPNIKIHLVSRPFFGAIFKDIDRLSFIPINPKEYGGLFGLHKLYKKLNAEVKPDVVLDLHQVVRTHMLNFFFQKLAGVKVYKINKGRDAKKEIVKTKVLKPMPSTIDRYCAVFAQAGLSMEMPNPPLLPVIDASDLLAQLTPNMPSGMHYIGIAPFSAHRQKEWGMDNFKALIANLEKRSNIHIVLFGAGDKETALLEEIAANSQHCSIANKHMRFADELRLMPHLSLMISMDSANMHFGAMAGIPVLSIWGATHAALGFAPYMQPADYMVQYEGDEISCRPCSVYGNKPCQYGDDIKCMRLISPDTVLNKIDQILA